MGPEYYKLTNDRVPCEQTVVNWMLRGKIGYDGERVSLGYIKRNGCYLTTHVWLIEFVEAMFDESL